MKRALHIVHSLGLCVRIGGRVLSAFEGTQSQFDGKICAYRARLGFESLGS